MLQIYKDDSTDYPVGNTDEEALIVGKNKKGLFRTIKKVYLGHDDNTKWYSDIRIYCTSQGSMDLINGQDGYSVKLYSGTLTPSDYLWERIHPGNQVVISQIGESGNPDLNFKPLYITFESPSDAYTGIYDFEIVIEALERAV